MNKSIKSIYQKYQIALVTEGGKLELQRIRLIGSIFMALSGFVLYLDKAISFFDISIAVPTKFMAIGWDQSLFIWFTTQTLTPIMICIGAWLKAYRVSIFVPIYAWFLQGYFLLFDAKIVDNTYLSIYALGTAVLLIFCIRVIDQITQKTLVRAVKERKKSLVEELN